MKTAYHIISGALAVLLIALVSLIMTEQPEFFNRLFSFDLPHIIVLCILGGMGGMAAFISYFEYHGIGPQDGIIRRGPHDNSVAITFDDGPNPIYTPQILDILKEKGVKATFFVVGLHVKKYPDIARRIVDEGHDIGNHTYTHKDLVPTTRRVVLAQVRKTEQIVQRVTGKTMKLFRPPRGIYSRAVRKLVVDQEGYSLVLWSVSSIDWRMIKPKAMLRRIARYTRPGSILLFHDSGALVRREGASRENTVEALPLIIDHLQAKGYEIIAVSEMLRRLEKPELDGTGILEEA